MYCTCDINSRNYKSNIIVCLYEQTPSQEKESGYLVISVFTSCLGRAGIDGGIAQVLRLIPTLTNFKENIHNS